MGEGMTHTITINGQELEVAEGGTVLAAALRAGIYIPHLCHHADLPPARGRAPAEQVWRAGERIAHDGGDDPHDGCGLCVVEVAGWDEPVASCDLVASDGLEIATDTPALRARRWEKLAAILAHHPHACITCAQKEGCSREPCSSSVPSGERCCPLLGRCEFEKLAAHVGVPPETARYVPRGLRGWQDALFAWEPELCVGCLRCVRACSDLKGVGILGWVISGGDVVVGHLSAEGSVSDCRYCGACVEVCPTGAITDRDVPVAQREERLVPCRCSCPAGVDVPRFLRAVAAGRLDEAARVSLDRLPLPNVLGRVCFHPCESLCRRTEIGGALSVCRVRRHVFDAVEQAADAWPEAADTGKRVAVIGSGPAGLSTAHFLRRKGHRVTVFEADAHLGGMLRHGIPEYRLPRNVLQRDLDLIVGHGVEIRAGTTVGRDVELAALRQDGFHAVLVAAGLGAAKPLAVAGVDLDGVLYGVPFLREVAAGSHSGTAFGGRRVVVIGGGNVAVDAGRSALRLGAGSVTLVCLESRDEIPAYPSEVEEARAEGIEILDAWGPDEILGDGGEVAGLRLVRCTSVFDGRGRFAPTFDRDTTREIEADTVIVAIGQQVERPLRDQTGLDFDARGLLVVDGDGLAAGDGVWGSGDVALGPSSVVEAVASARRAACSIDRHLGGDGEIPSILEPEQLGQWLGLDHGFAARPRVTPALEDPARRISSFSGVEDTLESAVALAEAGRCLQCDLRLQISPPVLPPPPWLELTHDAVAGVPETEGVYQLLGDDRVAVKIAGTPNLRQALAEELAADAGPPFFVYDLDPMYTKRESELIQQFLAAHGRMPDAGDELDDLF
jgi:NADPH-dependent glutamate synthase beta subunit-like oxidoreductase/NAD-dependent dihydropyrimidine dehydrogenase PreA subunit